MNKRAPATYGTTPRGTNGRPRSMDERVQAALTCDTSSKYSVLKYSMVCLEGRRPARARARGTRISEIL